MGGVVGVKNLVRVMAPSVSIGVKEPSSYSEVGPKPEEGHSGSDRTECLRIENREVDSNHEAGVRNP
jgi:hypothetical protein